MSYFEMMLSTLRVILCCGGFHEVNYNVISDTLILIEKNKLELQKHLQKFCDYSDVDNFVSSIECSMSAIIYARLESMLTKEREVELFERLFNSVCQVIDEQ